MISYTSNIHLTAEYISKLKQSVNPIALEEMKIVLEPYIIKNIQQFILDGGSSNTTYSWGYWQRKDNNWSYSKGKLTNVSNGWTGANILPIHPQSYLARKIRKSPANGQFALYDTGELFNSFKSISSFTTFNGCEMQIGSTSDKLDYHEVNFKYKRKIIEPYSEIFSEDKSIHNFYLQKVVNRLLKL